MQLIEALLDLCKKTPAVIAIDGPAGAGKTTLASMMKVALTTQRVEIVHMDDIYGGWEISSAFTARVSALVKDFKAGRSHLLDIYDWHEARFATQRTIAPAEILIIEGVGSGQRELRDELAALIWIEVADEIGMQRVLERDGEQISEQMQRWQRLQRKHFVSENTKSAADFELTT